MDRAHVEIVPKNRLPSCIRSRSDQICIRFTLGSCDCKVRQMGRSLMRARSRKPVLGLLDCDDIWTKHLCRRWKVQTVTVRSPSPRRLGGKALTVGRSIVEAALADGGALLPFCCTTVETRGMGLRIGRWDPKLQPTGILERSRTSCSDSGLNRLYLIISAEGGATPAADLHVVYREDKVIAVDCPSLLLPSTRCFTCHCQMQAGYRALR